MSDIIGKRLNSMRGKRSRREIAETLGCKEQTYTSWEMGRTEPNGLWLVNLSRFYNTTTDYILGASDIRDVSTVPPKESSPPDDASVLATAKCDTCPLVGIIHRQLSAIERLSGKNEQ